MTYNGHIVKLYEDNAGRKHLFLLDNEQVVGYFCDDGIEPKTFMRDTIRGLWETDYDATSDQWLHELDDEDAQAAYNDLVRFCEERNGGAWELDATDYFR